MCIHHVTQCLWTCMYIEPFGGALSQADVEPEGKLIRLQNSDWADLPSWRVVNVLKPRSARFTYSPPQNTVVCHSW